MKVLTVKDLELDVLDGEYTQERAKIFLKEGTILEKEIDSYTYDDEPFRNYIVVEGEEYGFDEIEKIELID